MIKRKECRLRLFCCIELAGLCEVFPLSIQEAQFRNFTWMNHGDLFHWFLMGPSLSSFERTCLNWTAFFMFYNQLYQFISFEF